ncbi:hypothetical protein BOTU111922_03000 [Bordetella tumulicola]
MCLTSYGVFSQDELPLLLNPAPGVSARIDKQGEDYVLIQPRGQRITLVSQDKLIDLGQGDPIFNEEDYDYDGYADIAIGLRAGMVNTGEAIYLYDARSTSYVPFDVPEDVGERQNCRGFWSIERLTERKAIRSTCRDEARWHYDILQIEPDRSIWISEQSRTPEDVVYWPYFGKPTRYVTYDRHGKTLREAVLSYEEGGDRHTGWVVPVKRLALYSAPDTNAATTAYLIKGDEADRLAFEGGEWMKIAYNGKKGRIERWVSLKDAYDLAKGYDPQQRSPDPLVLWAIDYRETRTAPDYYRNLFTLSLDNVGEKDIKIYQGEIHLLFTGPDGASAVHKLYDLSMFTVKPRQSRVLDDNVIEQHGGRYVIFHGVGAETDSKPEYVPFFPPDLAPGRYRVRAVLTDPGLHDPIYAKEEIEIDYPPRLPADLVKP